MSKPSHWFASFWFSGALLKIYTNVLYALVKNEAIRLRFYSFKSKQHWNSNWKLRHRMVEHETHSLRSFLTRFTWNVNFELLIAGSKLLNWKILWQITLKWTFQSTVLYFCLVLWATRRLWARAKITKIKHNFYLVSMFPKVVAQW